MNKTKQRIINKAIDLFNQEGVSQVTVRRIAKELSLSPGNLTYHFPHIESLIEAIYNQMVESMEQYYTLPVVISIDTLHVLLVESYNLQISYHFFFADLSVIKQRFPNIAKRHEELRSIRATQSSKLINSLISSGRLKKERPFFSYSDLVKSIWLLYPVAIQHDKYSDDKSYFPLPIQLAWNMILPHLTNKGYTQYKQLIRKRGTK